VRQSFFKEAFVAALGGALAEPLYAVYVTNFQQSSSHGTLVYFDIVLEGNDYVVSLEFTRVQSLFCDPAGGAVRVGSPACPALVRALVANGLPVAGAFYNDQLTASAYTGGSMPPITIGSVGTYQWIDSGEVIAIDIPYAAYADRQTFYQEAVIAGLASALGVSVDTVWVTNFEQSSAGTTLVFVDVVLGQTSSSAVTASFASIENLFESCNGVGNLPLGCAASPASGLVSAFKSFGLPVTNAYYNQQI